MEAHVTQALDNRALSIQATFKGSTFDIQWFTEKLAQGKLNSPTRRFHPTRNSRLVYGLPRNTGQRIHLGRVQSLVLIRNPGHFLCRGTHIWCGNILARMDQIPFDELVGESACYLLYFLFIVFVGVDAKATFRAPKRNIDHGTLVRHQRGKRFDLVLIDG